MNIMTRIAVIGLVAVNGPTPGFAQSAGQPDRGAVLYQRQCGVCHQVASPRNGAGPSLQGVIGRKAGTVAGFAYSPAMKDSGITWSSQSLASFIGNPTKLVPGTRMGIRVPNPDDAAAIAGFLNRK